MKLKALTLLPIRFCLRADSIGLFSSLNKGSGVLQHTQGHLTAASTQQGLARRFSLLQQSHFKGNS